MTISDAKRIVQRIWETGQSGQVADLAAASDLAELVERGMLATWNTPNGDWFMVTEAGKEFAGCRQGAAERIGRRR